MSFIPGWFPVGAVAARTPPSVTFVATTASAAATNHTFTGASIGAADATRRLIVALQWANSVAHRTISSFTIDVGAGAVSMGAAHVTVSSGDGFVGGDLAIYSILAPSAATTATFQVNTSGANTLMQLSVFRALNETSTTPFATMSDTSASGGALNASINITTNGWLVAASNEGGISLTGVSWTNATEQYDTGSGGRSGALESGLAAQTGRSITATIAASSAFQGCMGGVSWG